MSNKNAKHVLIISNYNFPYESAGAIRDMAFAKLYQELGYNVYCICCNQSKSNGIDEGVVWVSVFKNRDTIIKKIQSVIFRKERFFKALI